MTYKGKTMMTRRDQLLRSLEKHEKHEWKCGMCPSCYQREACPGGVSGGKCSNYLAPEPTRMEWPDIFKKALQAVREPCDTQEKVRRIGRVNAIRDAMHRVHGYSFEEIRKIEGRQ